MIICGEKIVQNCAKRRSNANKWGCSKTILWSCYNPIYSVFILKRFYKFHKVFHQWIFSWKALQKLRNLRWYRP